MSCTASPSSSLVRPSLPEIHIDEDAARRCRSVVRAYRPAHLALVDYKLACWEALPAEYRQLIEGYGDKMGQMRAAIEENAKFLEEVTMETDVGGKGEVEGVEEDEEAATVGEWGLLGGLFGRIVVEWSSEGEDVREGLFGIVIRGMESVLQEEKRREARVLVPGMGLGRLVWEIRERFGLREVVGVESEDLVAVLGGGIMKLMCAREKFWDIYPFALQVSNVRSTADQMRSVRVPEALDLPCDGKKQDEVSRIAIYAGEFLKLYAEDCDKWDCVASTCFIQNAHHAAASVNLIAKLLKPGGAWVNYGTQQFRRSQSTPGSGLQLTSDELLKLVAASGLRVTQQEMRSCNISANPRSMLQTRCSALYFVAIKD